MPPKPVPSAAQLLPVVRQLVPPLHSNTLHKGQSGRVGIVGGSEEYTGAPYFSGMTALRMGADLCHVFCEKTAGPPLKSYSPDLIVHPSLLSTTSLSHLPPHVPQPTASTLAQSITAVLPRIHVLIVGPGLSRDPLMLATAKEIVLEARRRDMPLVLDADGLYMVQEDPDVVKGYAKAVVTPNKNEFERLCEKMNVTLSSSHSPDPTAATDSAAVRLSRALGGVTVVQKGNVDVVSNGDVVLHCSTVGSPRRSGGQGDVLSGAIAAFLAWGSQAERGTWGPSPAISVPLLPLAAWSACHLTRLCARGAFAKHSRGTLAQDLVAEVAAAFAAEFEPDDHEESVKL